MVANARRVRLIAEGDAKGDRLDAELLARLGRVDPALLAPIQHRSETAQRDLGVVKARAALVRMRTLGINHVRGVAKALGHRLPACAAEVFPVRVRAHAAGPTLPGSAPLLGVLEQVTASIRALDRGRWRSCCIGSGSPARSMNRWAIARGRRSGPARTAADYGRRSGETVSG